jgi:replication fork protection complex subunit Csm3/Swi3
MATRDPVDRSGGPVSGGDEFDDLFNYDAEFDEIFNSKPSQKDTPRKDGERGRGETELDLFKKVEVVKKPRDPRVKLDEHRLLSAAGIPKLKKRAKDLKFKGKGHEVNGSSEPMSRLKLTSTSILMLQD